MKSNNSKKRQFVIITLTLAWGIFTGIIFLNVQIKPDTLIETILHVFSALFCSVSWRIFFTYCQRVPHLLSLSESIVFLTIQAIVYIGIGYLLSIAQIRRNNPRKVIQGYSKIIEQRPDSAVAYYKRGNAYSNAKQYDNAIHDYSKFIELKPDYFAMAYMNIMELALITNDKEQFRKWLKRLETEISGDKLSQDEFGSKLYLACVYKCIANEPDNEIEKQLDELLKSGSSLHWSFDLIDEWLSNPKDGLTPEQVKYIRGLTDKVKAVRDAGIAMEAKVIRQDSSNDVQCGGEKAMYRINRIIGKTLLLLAIYIFAINLNKPLSCIPLIYCICWIFLAKSLTPDAKYKKMLLLFLQIIAIIYIGYYLEHGIWLYMHICQVESLDGSPPASLAGIIIKLAVWSMIFASFLETLLSRRNKTTDE